MDNQDAAWRGFIEGVLLRRLVLAAGGAVLGTLAAWLLGRGAALDAALRLAAAAPTP